MCSTYSVDPLVMGGSIRVKLKTIYTQDVIINLSEYILRNVDPCKSIFEGIESISSTWDNISIVFRTQHDFASQMNIQAFADVIYQFLVDHNYLTSLSEDEKAFLMFGLHRIYLFDVFRFKNSIKIVL